MLKSMLLYVLFLLQFPVNIPQAESSSQHGEKNSGKQCEIVPSEELWKFRRKGQYEE